MTVALDLDREAVAAVVRRALDVAAVAFVALAWLTRDAVPARCISSDGFACGLLFHFDAVATALLVGVAVVVAVAVIERVDGTLPDRFAGWSR